MFTSLNDWLHKTWLLLAFSFFDMFVNTRPKETFLRTKLQ